MQFKQWTTYLATGLLATTFAISSQAEEDWSSTEVQFSTGKLLHPRIKGTGEKGSEISTSIITFQHASSHSYGDNFFFVDHSRVKDNKVDHSRVKDNKTEVYGEWYSNFSLGAITGNDMSNGLVRDIGLIAGLNFAPGADNIWALPGVRVALDLPGFAFANLDITGYNNITTASDADKEDSSYMVNLSWALPFQLGETSWSLEGHAEYIAARDVVSSSGDKAEKEAWILAQPQLRFDMGEALGGEAGNFFVGLEYQYWQNKQGNKDVDESTVQLLTVWNF